MNTYTDDYPLQRFEVRNWRGLSNIELPKLYKQQVIVGGNGTGKTSLLWAMITFIRALNYRASNSQYKDSVEVSVTHDMPDLLCQASLKDGLGECLLPFKLKNFSAEEKKKQGPILSATINGTQFQCTVELNGVCKLYPSKSFPLHSKIRFGFLTGDPAIQCSIHEVAHVADRILSSFSTTMFRAMFVALKDQFKSEFTQNLQSLFGVKGLHQVPNASDLIIIEENDSEIELVNTGTAFRKAYTILVLMYYLAQVPEPQRVFFIEEVEAFLHPSLQTALMRTILEVSDKYNIQLFITSCSSHVLKHFDLPQCFIMTSEKQVLYDSWTQNVVTLDLLGLKPESILIMCDGGTDEKFLSKIIDLMNLKHCLSVFKFYSNTSKGPAIDVLKKHFSSVYVIVLRDREFSREPVSVLCTEEGKKLGLKAENIFFWELPCIESYIVAHYFNVVDHTILSWLDLTPGSASWEKYALKYRKGITATNSTRTILYPAWSEAEQAANRIRASQIEPDDIFKLMKALRGHDLVDDIRIARPDVSWAKMVQSLTIKILDYPGMPEFCALLKNALLITKHIKST